MKTRCSPNAGSLGLGHVLVGAVLAAVIPLRALGAERVVLCEEFTATW